MSQETAILERIEKIPGLVLPQTYHEVLRRAVTLDAHQANLVRLERRDGRNSGLGGEHMSYILNDQGRLLGFTRMDAALQGQDLPTESEAEAIARDFLAEAAPDLLATLEKHWIAPHDETFRVTDGARSDVITVTGMKVKMRNTADGRWFWVIVGSDRKVMTFERNIVWATFKGRRQTEKWLHDSWLQEQGYTVTSR